MSSLSRAHRITIAVIVYIVIGAVLAEIAAGYVFFFFNKKVPVNFQWDLFIESWTYYAGDHQQYKRLVLALVAVCFAIFVVPGIAVIAALNKPRELHGSARFATPREIAKANLSADKGIILGKRGGRYLIQGGQTFVILAAPTRSGKGVATVIPNLLNWPDSIICLDMKYENFLYTSGFRARNGQEVYLFAPFSESGETHRWNPLGFVRRGTAFVVDDINSIAFDLWPDTGDAKSDFWNSLARDLFLGVASYVEQSLELPFTLAEIMRQGTGNGKEIKQHFKDEIAERSESGEPLPKYCTEALERFIAAAESGNTSGSIRSTFAEPLTIFVSPMVEMATSQCDFDIAQVRRRRMTIYLGVPASKLAQSGRLMNMFFAQTLNLNTKELPQTDPTLKYQCLLLADEFTAMGRIAMLSKAIGYMAGYGLRMLPIVQSIGQIRHVYKDETDNFVTNHETQILFAPREQKDAAQFSETLGYFTEKSQSRNRSRPIGFESKGGGSSGVNTSPQKRALMMPQELREMGNTQQIILIRGVKPILCEKSVYYNDPIFVDRLKSVSKSLRDLGKKLPTQKQLEEAAFVLRDLSVEIPKHDFGASRLFSPKELVESASVVDLGILNRVEAGVAQCNAIVLPPVDDQERPSKESVDAVVVSFFNQLDWVPNEPHDTDDAAALTGNELETRRIDLSVLET
jgi:type IV secretion system protein VirD4